MSQNPSHTKHDKHFFDSFMVVLGMLVAVAIVLIIVARLIGGATQSVYVTDDDRVRLATAERIAPVGKVAVSGQDNSALEPPKEAKAAPAQDMDGEQAFNMACMACHGAGVAGAPKVGDKSAWGPRVAQGNATLYEHALKGFQGKAGFMPARGGNSTFTDKTVTNAVDYMVKAAR
jgi:cytochrome c5